jgi:hypothetical protein
MIRTLVEALRAIHCRSGVGLPRAEARQMAALDFREARDRWAELEKFT